MSDDSIDVPPRVRRFGRLQYRRARGEAAEMESAKAVCRILARYYQPGMTLLDVGCGCGHYLLSLRSRLDASIEYRGVDKTKHYLELARRAFPGEDRFHVAEAEALPLADRSVDLVICMNVLPNVPPPADSAVAELIRVARRLVVIRTLFAELNYVIQELDPGDDDETQLIGANGVPRPGSAVYNNMYTERYYRSLIHKVDPGLEPVIEPDDQSQRLESNGPGGTRSSAGQQVAGPLLLDWRFIIIPLSSG